MTKRDVDREAIETNARRLVDAVMRHDLTVTQFWALLSDPAAAEEAATRTVSVLRSHGPE